MTKIKVTKDHIKNGQKSNCENCPVALAINVILKQEYHSAISVNVISLYNSEEELKNDFWLPTIKINTPGAAGLFIYKFDRRRIVSPIEFDLDIPKELVA